MLKKKKLALFTLLVLLLITAERKWRKYLSVLQEFCVTQFAHIRF